MHIQDISEARFILGSRLTAISRIDKELKAVDLNKRTVNSFKNQRASRLEELNAAISYILALNPALSRADLTKGYNV